MEKEQLKVELTADGGISFKVKHLGWSYYDIPADRLREANWIPHMAKKGWCDMNEFIPIYFEALKRQGVREMLIPIY